LNGAIYYTETEDMQDFSFFAGPFGSLRVVTNIDEAEIQGIELDAKWLLNQYFSVYAGVGLVDTEIKDYSTRPYTTGNKLPYIPDYTASLGAEFNTDLGSSGWELNARVDTMFVGETWFSPVQDNYVPNFFTAFGFGGGEFSRQKRDAYSTTDLTISLTDGSWSVQAWGKNVFDKNYLEEVIPAPEFGGSFIHETFGRTYGLTVSKNFGGE
jgi:iron complex outermembrane receptor protein